jgi:signal transduction histidine kinase
VVRRPRATILVKLLAAFALPTVALFALFAYVALQVSSDDLDAELGTRMSAVASSAATQIRGKYLTELQAGDEDKRAYLNVRQELQAVSRATGVRLFVFDRAFASRVDTDDGVAIGTRYYQAELDRLELARVFDSGASVASVTFEGADGRTYKAGYAAVRASEDEPEIVLALGAQAPAAYFDRLAALRRSLLWWGVGVAAVVVLAAWLSATLLTRDLRKLAIAADRIGHGNLRDPVPVSSSGEIGTLAATMERMRAQLSERDARMQQMLAGIAHEVRNPLAGMTLFTDILRDELPADAAGDDARGHVDKIRRELGYLERVVTDFLDYARRPVLEREPVELGALLEEVAALARADGGPVEVDAGAAAAGQVHADRAQLRRALHNLARNAQQATSPSAPPVVLRASARGAEVVVEVENTGAAIPPEIQARLFDPFFTTREKGTGLGLAFVRDAVVAHGGTVEVRCAGGRTTFSVTLPSGGGSAPPPAAPA